ncbi:putative T6SS immunity periplasmic lipoprotein [Paramixta manurensis]
MIILTCLLSGCPGPGDRVPPKQPANVTMRNNHLCIIVSTQPGEQVASVQISDGKNNNLRKLLNDPISVASGQCLPTFGYDFKPGHDYVVYYTVEKNNLDEAKYFFAEFSINSRGLQQVSSPAEK